MPYEIDRGVLLKVAQEVVGLPLESGEPLTRATQLLADEYPDLIDPTPGRWVGIKAGGILGNIEYGRGAVATTLPFAMVDTLFLSLEFGSVRRSTVEFIKLVRKRVRP
ncbi:hypothetical protein [Mycobacterium sp.]|uniref:hypothetical protein n=1 Tax=Mycobacterium sp. TaxID=1785 RepID=UPI003BAFF4A5